MRPLRIIIRVQRIEVIDSRIKVLLVDQSPRWEFKYLQMMLLRDRRVDLKCFLVEGDKAISRTADSPFPEFPARRDELFKYDLVILGDVDPKVLTALHQENLNKLVSDFGGALVVLAGKRHIPAQYRRSVLEKLLPVAEDREPPTIDSKADPITDKPIEFAAHSGGSRQRDASAFSESSMTRRTRSCGRSFSAIFSGRPGVTRAKPAAEVLVVGDPDVSKESAFRQDAGHRSATIWPWPGDVRGHGQSLALAQERR